ncbi:hypothetical protein JQ581_30010 [Bradyrhizobium liaoningense]|uniref:hypothetical protein n=1 Tax=Bradyrhizobium liaoningense TaxID=43992 RepID=UPI001BAC5068|nr:hypothetical protein [Bradyrhizobium liaoningense]MBR0741175.1 hypothetical protein [Bradyrhizobium liaoningense]
MSKAEQLRTLRELKFAHMGSALDIAKELIANQETARRARGDPEPPPPPPPKPKRVRRCSPTSRQTLAPWALEGISRRTWYRNQKKISEIARE